MERRPELYSSFSGRPERRRYPRYSLDAHGVSFQTEWGESRGVVLNLSEGGMMVHTSGPVEPGSPVQLRWELRQPAEPPGAGGAIFRADKVNGGFRVEFPDLSEHIEQLEAEAIVLWVDGRRQRFGIKFQNPSKAVEQSLFRWSLHHELRAPEPALPIPQPVRGMPVPLLPANHMPREVRPGRRPWVSAVAIVALVGLAFLGGGAYWEAHANRSDGTDAAGAADTAPMLRLAGSNTIGSTLAPALAEAFLKNLGARDIHIVAGANAEEESVQANLPGLLPGTSSPVKIQIAAHGSSTAFEELMNASCDIGMSSRKIKPKEISRLSSLADWSSPASEHLLGLDGIAVIVNSSNPVQMLTKDQLAGIFSGAVVDWSEVSSQHGPIQVYAPDNKSGTYDAFKTIILASKSLDGDAKRMESNRAVSDQVARDQNGIGFVGLPFVMNAKAIAVGERGATPFQPNRLTVGTEDYLLSRRLYFYTPANPQNKYVRKFVDFALSKAGQEVVGDAGFVAQNVTSEREMIAPNAPPEYRRLTQSAQRLSLDFRFMPGLTKLDSKAHADLDRVVSFLADSGYTGNDVLLLGFADNTGNRDTNVTISQSRAKLVAAEFAQRGLKPATVKGFGSDLPVASNENDMGRERNRRVEIWLKESQCIAPRAVRDPG